MIIELLVIIPEILSRSQKQIEGMIIKFADDTKLRGVVNTLEKD